MKIEGAQMTALAIEQLSNAGVDFKTFLMQLVENLNVNCENGESGIIALDENVLLAWIIKKNVLLVMVDGENARIEHRGKDGQYFS